MKTYNELPTYVRSVNKRDQILEKLLIKARARQSDHLRHFISLTLQHVNRYYPMLNREYLDPHTVANVKRLEWEIEQSINAVMPLVRRDWMKFRRRVYAFSWAATQKALFNAGKSGKPEMMPAGRLVHHVDRKSDLGGVLDRIHLSFERLKRKVIDAVQMSRILVETHEQALIRAGRAFPAARIQKRLHELTRALVESDKPYKGDALYGPMFIDAEDWEDIVSEYKDEYVPDWRDPRYEMETPVSAGEDGEYTLYPWQVEQEMTEDFVSSVRAGEVDSANAQGINDIVWIAILDSHTDDCCRKRDGLTNTEIEVKLEGEWAGDECQASTPPAHFNCRCRIAPATDDLPDKPADNSQDLEDWLNS